MNESAFISMDELAFISMDELVLKEIDRVNVQLSKGMGGLNVDTGNEM